MISMSWHRQVCVCVCVCDLGTYRLCRDLRCNTQGRKSRNALRFDLGRTVVRNIFESHVERHAWPAVSGVASVDDLLTHRISVHVRDRVCART
jgi:hypothetical protein